MFEYLLSYSINQQIKVEMRERIDIVLLLVYIRTMRAIINTIIRYLRLEQNRA
jgi:hypothetical protein